jgi:hypothetical protein
MKKILLKNTVEATVPLFVLDFELMQVSALSGDKVNEAFENFALSNDSFLFNNDIETMKSLQVNSLNERRRNHNPAVKKEEWRVEETEKEKQPFDFVQLILLVCCFFIFIAFLSFI